MQVNLFSSQDVSLPFSTSLQCSTSLTSPTSTTSHLFKTHDSSIEGQLMEDSPDTGFLGSSLRLSTSSLRENNNLCKDIFTFTTTTNAQCEWDF
jgi:hypothetical protein